MMKDKHQVKLEAIERADLAYTCNSEDMTLLLVEHNRNVGFAEGFEAGYAQAIQDVDLTFVNTELAEARQESLLKGEQK